MNIDNLIEQWGNYERMRLESGSGFQNKTILAKWGESQSFSDFCSSTPSGNQYDSLTDDIIKIRRAVNTLEIKHKNAICYKFVINGYMTDELCHFYLNFSRNTSFDHIRKAKKQISLYLREHYPLPF